MGNTEILESPWYKKSKNDQLNVEVRVDNNEVFHFFIFKSL